MQANEDETQAAEDGAPPAKGVRLEVTEDEVATPAVRSKQETIDLTNDSDRDEENAKDPKLRSPSHMIDPPKDTVVSRTEMVATRQEAIVDRTNGLDADNSKEKYQPHQITGEYDKLKQDHDKLTEGHDKLKDDHGKLTANYAKLREDHDSLMSQLDKLKTEFEAMQKRKEKAELAAWAWENLAEDLAAKEKRKGTELD